MNEKNMESLLLHPEQKRVEISLGYSCNNRCVFCSEDLHRKGEVAREARELLTTGYLTGHLSRLKERGFEHLTFLGGEPTIRQDFFELVRAAKGMGFRTIFLTTNGRMLAKKSFVEAIFKAGISRLYISLHGHDAETHDGAVRAKGAFEQVVRAFENLRETGKEFCISSVIFKGNVRKLPELMEFELAQKPARIFWAFVRPVGAARDRFFDIVPSFEEMDRPLKEALELGGENRLPVTVAHVPLCRMSGYERHVDELYWSGSTVEREVDKFVSLKQGRKTGKATLVTSGHNKLKHDRCIDCRYIYVCEGVHEEYARRKGFEEFAPVRGEAVMEASELRDASFLEEL